MRKISETQVINKFRRDWAEAPDLQKHGSDYGGIKMELRYGSEAKRIASVDYPESWGREFRTEQTQVFRVCEHS